jgi:hypothetical protein
MPLLFYFPFIVWMGLMEVAARRDAHSRQGQGATAITTLDTITQVRAPLR